MATYYQSLDGTVTKGKKKGAYFVGDNGKVIAIGDEDIAPVKENRSWFQKGAFSDGYNFGDITKTILGTRKDVKENLYAGVAGIAESAIDAGAAVVGGAGGLLGADGFQESVRKFVEKDLIDEKKVAGTMDNITGGIPSWISASNKKFGADNASLLGDRSDSLLQSGGQLAGTAVLQSVGVPWYVTTGATSFGSQAEEAFKEDATYGQAVGSALVSAGAEILSEKLSGGIKFGGKTVDDVLLKPLTKKIANKTARTLVNLGVDAVGEGFEEVFSSAVSNMGKSLYKEENAWELLTNEEAMDEYVESFIGGMVIGGGANVGKATKSIVTGRDYETGLTDSEKTVVDKEVENRIKEREEAGEKVFNREKASIEEEVKKDLERGYIDTDSIESVLGGESYTEYKSLLDERAKLDEEIDRLRDADLFELSDDELNRRYELKSELQKIDERIGEMRETLDHDMTERVRGSMLAESYIEKDRRSRKFEADLNQYTNEYAKKTVQNFMEHTESNNTNRTHDFIDLLTKVSEDRGHSFDFMTTAQIEESIKSGNPYGIDADPSNIEAFVSGKDKTIIINMDNKKSLSSLVGHETTHTLEGAGVYDALQEAVFKYAQTKKEYADRLASIQRRYKGADADYQNKELTADLLGDYLFSDADFIKNLSTERPNIFKRIFNEIKYLCKMATAGSQESRELERVKHLFEKAWRESGVVESGTRYSLGTTTDGRFVAVVDNDILSGIDTTTWDKAKKEKAKKAASDALKNFSEGIVVDGVTRKVNRTSRREYTRSKYTEWLYHNTPDVFADKMRAAEVAEDIVVATTNWKRDGALDHPRKDDFVDFDHGTTLILSGDTKYVADVVVGITDDGEAVFYDVVDMTPTLFDMKKESPTTATTQNAIGDIKRDSSTNSVPQSSENASDKSYLDAVNRGDMENAQKMVDEAAKRAGYTIKGYHGTQLFGFTQFREGKYGIFLTDNPLVAGTYGSSKKNALGRVRYVADKPVMPQIDILEATRDEADQILTARDGVYELYAKQGKNYVVDCEGNAFNEIPTNNKIEQDLGIKSWSVARDGRRVLSTNSIARYAKNAGYDSVTFKNVRDIGEVGFDASTLENIPLSTVFAVFDPSYIKSADVIVMDDNGNVIPLSERFNAENNDIRYSLRDSDGSEIDSDRVSQNEYDVKYSLAYSEDIAHGQRNYVEAKMADAHVTMDDLKKAQSVTEAMVDVMMKYSSILPEDKIGKVLTKNGSYDISVENTTICVRTLAYNEFVDKVQEQLGRPMTQMESFLVSQKLYDIATDPQCLYCYVSLDRKAFNDMLLRYMSERDTVIEKYRNSDKTPESISKLYEEFLNGRKDTKQMKGRFDKWIGYVDNGAPLLSLADISTESRQSKIKLDGGNLAEQLKDARQYAQSASWSKIQKNYVAYKDEILRLSDKAIRDLNKHYGLRWYSFSDYSPAFIVENMQQITDAAIRGLKGLSYTKDTDFAEVFAPSGMNINVSVFVNADEDGNFYIDERQSANFEKAKALREQYPNVGIVATVTNDEALRWAASQEWSDVIIPFHIVRTGTDVAEYYKWLNYTGESGDKIGDADLWNAYLDSLNVSDNARKKVSKNIYPSEHKNNKETYLSLCESRGLTPRFARFAGEDWYMKLVNETRLSADQSIPLRPIFNEEVAKASFEKFVEKGGYEGGWYKDDVDVDAEVGVVADDIRAGKKANEVDYGRQDIAPVDLMASRKANRQHSKNRIADDDLYTPKEYGYFNTYAKDLALDESATAAEEAPVKNSFVPSAAPTSEDRDKNIAPTKNEGVAKVLIEEPETEKKKSHFWSSMGEALLDKGFVFENLAKKTKNRNLEAKWNFIRYADGMAQDFIGNGTDGVRPLYEIQDEVKAKGLEQALSDYVYHLHNIDRMNLEDRYEDVPNKPVYGDSVTSDVSRGKAKELEAKHPELKKYANELYAINNHLRQMLVDGGVISQETADLWSEMYPHYMPIRRVGDHGLNINVPLDTGRTGINAPVKKAVGGSENIMPLFNTISGRIFQTYKAVAKNRFGVELKNTLGTTVATEATDVDGVIEGIETNDELLQKGKNGRNSTFTVFDNGERVTFEITDDMYNALKPTNETLAHTIKPLNALSNLHRGVLTEFNPAFLARNIIKDAQDVLINSQHPVRTYKAFPKAIKEMATKGKWLTEYTKNGGEQNTYFDRRENTFVKEKSGLSKAIGIPLEAISNANNAIERLPRLAEYIASRESGRGIEESMLDAARVTTNFSAGGDFTKFLNRNGATFLNASVQGTMQQVRNFREAKMNGFKGVVQLAAKFAVAGLPVFLMNGLLWDDDDDYEELSDYVKENYYIVAKYGDGKFVRIPKGRTVAVIQNALEQTMNGLTGNDEVDLRAFLELAVSNLAPNNPIENNILSPIIQTATNTTWYGDDLVPTRLQDLPPGEQSDESTDAISKWLGEKTNMSPYKINYLIDQYTGVVGDVFLPMLTPEAESGDNSLLGNMLAPVKNAFTTDSVMNNQNVSDFYDTSDELTVNAKKSYATDEDILANKYFNSVKTEVGKLYAEKREIQNSDLSDSEKYYLVREIQKKIDALAKEGLSEYEDVRIDGSHATVGDKQYRKTGNGWEKLDEKQLEKQNNVMSSFGISASDYWNNKEEFDFAYESPGKYAISNVVGGYDSYTEYKADMKDMKIAEKESYIFSLDLDYGQKAILFRSYSDSKANKEKYNPTIAKYLNSRKDISLKDKISILDELDMKMDYNGKITW